MCQFLDQLQLTASCVNPPPSLARVEKVPSSKKRTLEERVIIRQLFQLDNELDYVLFKVTSDSIPPQIEAVVIDNERRQYPLSDNKLAEIHKKIWLRGGVPILYVGWQDKVDVLACMADADFLKGKTGVGYHPVESIKRVDEALKKYSATHLLDGTFWDDESRARRFAHASKSAHKQLLEKIRQFDIEMNGTNHPASRRLLLQSIMIKYLEDRKVFKATWFAHFTPGCRSFLDVLTACVNTKDIAPFKRLLRTLEKKFNGGIFEPSSSETTLQSIRKLSNLLNTKQDTRGQLSFWDLYSFEYIPVEVISQIYEMFAFPNTGSVYTPPSLVNLILHKVMPLNALTGKETILDPTCGSGVFLVSALQRLFNAWRLKNKWVVPEPKTLQEILSRSIFGIDIQAEAIELTAFSLALAICDALQPEVIWKDLTFERLIGRNLVQGNCLELPEKQPKSFPNLFSLIIGNPPFKGDENAKTSGLKASAPDKNIAGAMLAKSKDLLVENGVFSLVQPATMLYGVKSKSFRSELFLSYLSLDTIYDFVSLRDLFLRESTSKNGDIRVVVFFGQKRQPDLEGTTRHCTFRRTIIAQERRIFELDYYDTHDVPRKEISDYWAWRANLLGGGRLRLLAQRWREFPPLSEYIDEKTWEMGGGFIKGKNVKGRKDEKWLEALPFLPTNSLGPHGVDKHAITELVGKGPFKSAYTLSRYTPPMFLIREHIDLFHDFWNEYPLAYAKRIIGISAPQHNEMELKKFAQQFTYAHKYLRAACRLLGTQSLILLNTASTLYDIARLPWPENNDWEMAEWEEVLVDDLNDYYGEYVCRGQNSELLSRAATTSELEAYTSWFVKMLGSMYPNLKSGNTLKGDGLFGQIFYFGEMPQSHTIGDNDLVTLNSVIAHDVDNSLRLIRLFRYYDQNAFIMIKPDRLRYWLKSVAIQDADTVLADLLEWGF